MENQSKIPRSVRERYRFSMNLPASGKGNLFETEGFGLSRVILGTDQKSSLSVTPVPLW